MLREGLDLPEVDQTQSAVRQHDEVAGMRVAVKQPCKPAQLTPTIHKKGHLVVYMAVEITNRRGRLGVRSFAAAGSCTWPC